MPRGDGTGPLGEGRMTGRGMGYCSGSNAPGYANGWGRGFNRGWGRGLGLRRGFGYGRFSGVWGRGSGWGYGAYPASITPKDELEALKREASLIKDEMELINKRIKEIESSNEDSK